MINSSTRKRFDQHSELKKYYLKKQYSYQQYSKKQKIKHQKSRQA